MTIQSLCRYCNAEVPPADLRVWKSCGNWKCRLAHQRHRQNERESADAIWREKFEESSSAAVAAREASNHQDAADYLPIVTPANTRQLTRLSRRRKYRFLKRLLKLIDALPVDFDDAPKTTAPPRQEDSDSSLKIFAQACANCRGKCCQRGGTHAYLDPKTIGRSAASFSLISKRQLTEAYFRYLPEFSYRGSCVFHAENGCRLPSVMRSATCNSTICGGLSELKSRIEIDGASRFFLAAVSNEKVIRTKFAQVETPSDDDHPLKSQ